ncbi:uncharacterized protein JN550_010164 [Neoarthrinium moseri]|uniref:uncharacterized protein n=1 Tax=Neoarthrinium moseri TaxID=1658444 RepID=UPI001FDB2891|nr:uncharacterized protein JN550_010164 [Neoarthrinium moseri]KAI1862639.1 hypothetical protein JN550_010164 [Neoarthrinium moseri]
MRRSAANDRDLQIFYDNTAPPGQGEKSTPRLCRATPEGPPDERAVDVWPAMTSSNAAMAESSGHGTSLPPAAPDELADARPDPGPSPGPGPVEDAPPPPAPPTPRVATVATTATTSDAPSAQASAQDSDPSSIQQDAPAPEPVSQAHPEPNNDNAPEADHHVFESAEQPPAQQQQQQQQQQQEASQQEPQDQGQTSAVASPAPNSASALPPAMPPVSAFQQLRDQYMPSPPTVSPLSTPAVTAVHSTNGDGALDDDDDNTDFPRLNDERPAAHPDPDAMDIDQSLASQQAQAQSQSQSQGYAAVATTDDDIAYPPQTLPSSTRANMSRHASLSHVDPAAYMISLAQANQIGFNYEYPDAIAPSEISLAASQFQDDDNYEQTSASVAASQSQKLESFATIDFADSEFQMTTYAVIIGRDQRAMQQARKDERRAQRYQEAVEQNEAMGLPPPTPVGRSKGKFSKSYVSEEGGMLGPESDGEDSNAPVGKAPSEHNDPEDEPRGIAKSNRQYVSHSEGAAAIDLSSLQPSTSHVPFVGIHSPGPNIAARTKSISRKHMKIQFNERRGVFEGISLHRNGFFCDDVHYGLNKPATLRCGARLQIKDVDFSFRINGVELGKTGAEELDEETSSKVCSVGGKEMSLEFEHDDKKHLRDTSDSLSPIPHQPTPSPLSEDGEPPADEIMGDIVEAPIEEQVEQLQQQQQQQQQHQQQVGEQADSAMAAHIPMDIDPIMQLAEATGDFGSDFMIPQLPRRRGPGRPPKDGIMSKRERRLLKKQLEAQQSQKTVPQEPPGEKIKRPVGRPRKNPLPEGDEKPEKRKYTKRKREDDEEGSDGERQANKKDKKVRPKSPPLDLRREDYTEEQLQKPAKNYVVLIDEALTAGPPEGLHLKQIYKRITARYPWYYFFAETKGWESSVRHNLIGNDAFKKNEETNLWQRIPGIELDAGKKRKVTTPEPHLGNALNMGQQQQYYHNGNYMQHGGMGNGIKFEDGLPGQHSTYPAPPMGQHNQPYANLQAQRSTQHVLMPQSQGPTAVQSPVAAAGAVMPQQAPRPQQSAYSSPYARPPPSANISGNAGNMVPNTHSRTPSIHQPAAQVPQAQPAGIVASSAGSSQPGLHPDDEKALATFKDNMLKALSKSVPLAKATQLIETAFNRALGLPSQASIPGFETVEKRLTDGALDVLRETRNKRQNPPPSASPAPAPPSTQQSTPALRPSPAAAPNVDAEIQASVKAFRDNFVLSLKQKTNQAEAIVDSAINQAQGLPSAGKFKGWEQVHDLLVEHVTKTINGARKKHGLQPLGTAPASAGQSQGTPSATVRQTPSASPAPVQPSTPSTTANGPKQQDSQPPPAQRTPSAPNQATPTMPSVPRPGISVARPSSIGIARPGAVSIARPSINRQTSAAPTTMSPSAPPSAPASAPAPPSAPPLGSQPATAPTPAPSTTPMLTPAPQTTQVVQAPAASAAPALAPASAGPPHPISAGIGVNGGVARFQDSPVPKTVSPALQTMAHPPMPKTASPAPPPTTTPSAGVMEQIMGQKRGQSNENAQQHEPKKLPTSS